MIYSHNIFIGSFMKTISLFFVLALSSPLIWANINPQSKALTELFETMNMDQTTEEIIVAMIDAQVAANPTAIKPIEKEFGAFLRKHASFKALEKDLREIYSKNYNEQEIADLTAFYQTATGRKVLATTPKITAEMTVLMQERLLKETPAFYRSLEKNEAAKK